MFIVIPAALWQEEAIQALPAVFMLTDNNTLIYFFTWRRSFFKDVLQYAQGMGSADH